MKRINTSRQSIAATQRNCNYRPSGAIAQHVIDATIIDARITASVQLCRATEPVLVGRAVVETGKQFFLVASKFEHRFYVAVYRDGSWQCSSREEATVAMVIGKAEAYRQELIAAKQAAAISSFFQAVAMYASDIKVDSNARMVMGEENGRNWRAAQVAFGKYRRTRREYDIPAPITYSPLEDEVA